MTMQTEDRTCRDERGRRCSSRSPVRATLRRTTKAEGGHGLGHLCLEDGDGDDGGGGDDGEECESGNRQGQTEARLEAEDLKRGQNRDS
jgi:hypothetical protein